MKKYELIPEFKNVYRIKAVRDIPKIGVKKGDFGGLLDSDSDLSHEGNCWVFGNSGVSESTIKDDVIIMYSFINKSNISSNVFINNSFIKESVITDNCKCLGCEINKSCLKNKVTIKDDSEVIDSDLNGDFICHNVDLMGFSLKSFINPPIRWESCTTKKRNQDFLYSEVVINPEDGLLARYYDILGYNHISAKSNLFFESEEKISSSEEEYEESRVDKVGYYIPKLDFFGSKDNLKICIKTIHKDPDVIKKYDAYFTMENIFDEKYKL